MEETKKIWLDGKFVNWQDAKIHVLTHTLHYGGGVFEGIRAYQTKKGPAVFRLDDHLKRFYSSALGLEMKIPFSKRELKQAILKLIKINKVSESYIRPIAFYGYGKMGLYPKGASVKTAIALWPWSTYLGEKPIKVIISKFIRLHLRSVISNAKVCGYYVNSIYASLEAKKKKADEALLLDYQGYLAEGPGENIFIVKNTLRVGDSPSRRPKIFTPFKTSILPGITRDTVFKIARDLKLFVKEKKITPKELKSADEVFFTGTAAEICPIGQIDKTIINNGKIGKITSQIRDLYRKIIHGEEKKYLNWLTLVK